MSPVLKDMLTYLKNHDHGDAIVDKIIAALRAGEAMRLDLDERTAKEVSLWSVRAWDAATKEDV